MRKNKQGLGSYANWSELHTWDTKGWRITLRVHHLARPMLGSNQYWTKTSRPLAAVVCRLHFLKCISPYFFVIVKLY